MITTKVGPGHGCIVQMSEEAFEAHKAQMAKEAGRRALRKAIRRGLNPFHWFRRWSERRALRRFMREEGARLGTAIQALDFALDAREDDAGDHMDRLGFLETWREGGDLSEWPAYRPQVTEPEVIAP